MHIFYDLIFLIIAVIYTPVYLFKKKFHRGFLVRLGFLPKSLALNSPIWIHAVSVGEVMAIKGLLQDLKKAFAQKKFVLSTVTATGNKIARVIAKPSDFVTYLPLDFSFIVKNVIGKINPHFFVIAETEIWPNLISYLYRKNIPVIIVNGRISDASYRGYLAIKFLLKPILKKITLFCVQTERDAKRLVHLGVLIERIKVTGNMKFDLKIDSKQEPINNKLKLGTSIKGKLFVAGSTHPKEEEIILGAYKELLNEFPELKLLIAPRHPERSSEVAQIVSRFGYRAVLVSSLPFECSTCITRTVFILDTVGELISFYKIADIVFVGGSLVKKGGHNILEPAIFAKPILFGPHMFNFRDIADLFLSNKAGILVYNQDDLKTNITSLLNNPDKTIELGRQAEQLVLGNQGATKKNLDFISQFM
jgi:3-deoxy-D-manno-octulosonic-acid transferase